MEKISWKDKKTNEEIIHMVQEDRKILNTIWYRKHKWMGRVLWHDGVLQAWIKGGVGNRHTPPKPAADYVNIVMPNSTRSLTAILPARPTTGSHREPAYILILSDL